MAANYDFFNPTPQDVNVPDFRNYTREVTAPQANKGMEVALTAAGKGIKDVGEIVKDSADLDKFLHRERIRNEAYAQADEAQNLEFGAKEAQLRSLGVDPQGAPTVGNLLPSDVRAEVDNIPDLKDLPAEAAKWRAAKELRADNKLKVSADMMVRLKQLRAANPEYRDYIDKVFATATGEHPANYRRNALDNAISVAQAAINEPIKKAVEVATREGNLGIAGITDAKGIAAIQRGDQKAINSMYDAVGRQQQHKIGVEQQLQDLKLEETRHNVVDTVAATNTVHDMVGGWIGNELKNQDLVNGHNSMQATFNWQQEMSSGKFTPQQIADGSLQHSQYLVAKISQFRNDAYAKAQSNPILFRQAGNMEKYMAMVDQELTPLTKLLDNYGGKNFSAATFNELQIKANRDAVVNEITSDPKYGRYWLAQEYAEKFPTYAKKFYEATLPDGIQKGMSEQLVAMGSHTKLTTLAPPDSKNPAPIKSVLTRIENSDKLSASKKALLADDILSDAISVTDPDMPKELRKNKLDNFFNDASAGLLSLINPNYINEKGKPVRGRQSVYADFADPKMVKVAKDIGGQTWINYQSFMKKEFSEQLFKQDIKDLHGLGQVSPNLHIGWNDVDHRWVLDYRNFKDIASRPEYVANTDKEISLAENHALRQSSQLVNRLNYGISSYANVLREAGGDINAELLKTMKEAGLESPEYTGDNLINNMSEAFKTMARHIRSEMKKPTKKDVD